MHTTRLLFRGCVCVSRGCTPLANRMTDRCKNITFPQLPLQAVIKAYIGRCKVNSAKKMLPSWLFSTNGDGQIGTPFLMVTLYYAKLFPLVQIRIWIPVRRVSQMVTVPILGMDLHPRDISPSLFYIFESGDHTLNLNQWKNLRSLAVEISHQAELNLFYSDNFNQSKKSVNEKQQNF